MTRSRMTYDGALMVVDEIQARTSDFFTDTVLTINSDDLRTAVEEALPASVAGSLDELGSAVRRAWEARGVRYTCGDTPSDPVALELLRGVRDMAGPGLACGVGSPEATEVQALLRTGYRAVTGPSGTVGAYVRTSGSRPLLLLNALGLPIRIWSRFLGGDHDYQIIVPVLPSCDLLAGGMVETSSARQLAATLQVLLDQLAVPQVDVLAWCNGGRVGVELLRLACSSIGTLVLLSPTFRGSATESGRTSFYEDNLDKLFLMVAEAPNRAAPVSMMLRLPQPVPAWPELTDQPEERAAQLFGMPRAAFATAMTEPMATPASLVHYVQRTYLDEAISGETGSPLPGERIVLIQGSHDSIVDNVQTGEWLQARAPGFTCYEISGAGHYVHDLEYPYLLHLLHRVFDSGAATAGLPARVREILGGKP